MSVVIANGGGNWDSGSTWVGLIAPTAADDVTATGTSGNLTTNGTDVCRSLDFTNYVGTFTHSFFPGKTLTIGDGTAGAGNIALKLAAGMTITTSTGITFASTSSTQQTITTNGKSPDNITVNGAGSSYLLADALTCSSTGLGITVTNGALDTNGKTVTAASLTCGASGTLTLNGSSVVVGSISLASGATFSGASSTITLTGGLNQIVNVASGNTLGIIRLDVTAPGFCQFAGSNSFTRLERLNTGAKTVKFTDGTTTTLTGGTSAFFSGTSGNLITVTGTSTGGWTLSSSVDLSCDYLSISRCTMTGGGKLYCGTHSTDGGNNNANVVFTDPPAAASSGVQPFTRW